MTNTQSITRAMQLVAASKLKRAQTRLLALRETYACVGAITRRLLTFEPPIQHTLLGRVAAEEGGAEAPTLLILVSSDAGLCGAYNLNVLRAVEAWLTHQPGPVEFLGVGRRGLRYAQRRGWQMLDESVELAGLVRVPALSALAERVTRRFVEGQAGRVMIAYTHFTSLSSWQPRIAQLLPIAVPAPPHGVGGEAVVEYICEPSRERLVDHLLPLWVRTQLLMLVVEALASEHSARMIAMKNATDNAEEMIDLLTLRRNKIRQASITKELSEIVGTAEALK